MNTILTNRSKNAETLNEYQSLLQRRFDKLLTSLLPEFKEKTQATNALVLSDSELLELLYTTQLEHKVRTPARELRKLKRRAENLALFYQELDKMGGTIKTGDVAEILGISRQAVNIRVKNGKLLAFRKNSDYVFPTFQFTTGGVLPYFEDVMKVMGVGINPVSKMSFLTTPLPCNRTPLDIMMKSDASENELALMLRAASQVGHQIAS
ncbi:helix-turn-helix domain-containing protein [Photorhabdus sp. APURE]|uniref:DNA-binding protein n=1 Tax=Photorhabdus aballayi TaxID=2991723 RepID=UPI00223CA7FC|nr:DNA-binding protein [Photorhabdus aballayi]MCW7548861.1 helix-turn-helix domain-containing protein [Photorhabdus aballayi]